MNVYVINKTIRAMCDEVKVQGGELRDWHLLTEAEFLYEAAVCIFGSQMVFEMAVAIADRLRDLGLLRPYHNPLDCGAYESRIVESLSEPLALVGSDGAIRLAKPRFKNRLASLLATTVAEIYGKSHSIQSLLCSAVNASEAREALIERVWGFGPKQASLFLRRVGYCADLAVLDVHVLDYLRLTRGLSFTSHRLGHLAFYEEIEDTFREVAAEFGHSLGCVDLATWLTMRVAKREA